MNQRLITMFYLISCALLICAGCNSSMNNDISFHYTLGDTTKFGENFLIDLNYVVKNNSKQDINYISESCNGLDYFIVPKPYPYEVMPSINCYVTWGIIEQIKPGDSIEYKTQLFMYEGAEPIEKIGLDFRTVDEYIPFDTLKEHPDMIEDVYSAKMDEKNIIWSKEQ